MDFAAISLFQVGALRHLPDLPGRVFASDEVNGSAKAYPLGVPDGPLGAVMYAALLALVGAGGTRATGRPAAASWLTAAVAGCGVGASLVYLVEMTRMRKACPYCLVGAGLNFAIGWLAVRDLRRA